MNDKSLNTSPVHDSFAFPTSYAQQRLWLLHRLDPDNPAYNIPAAFRLRGPIDVNALSKSVQEVVRRHETLRTTFVLLDEEPKQLITTIAPSALTLIDLRTPPEPERESEWQRRLAEESTRCFDLENGPLFRVSLLLIDADQSVLIINQHHIVSDGWSLGVLFRELSDCYNAFSRGQLPELPELTIQYADFAIWQREWLTGKVLAREVAYWKKQLDGIPPLLNLPTDRPRPAVQSFSGQSQSLWLSPELTTRLKCLSQKHGATLFMTLLAAFQTLLYRYTGQEDIVVGSPIANRNRAEIESLIGFFVNTLVLRSNFAENPTFQELLDRVRNTALEAYEHQDVPFEKLVEELQPERSLSYSPLFQVMFVLQNAPSEALKLGELAVSPVRIAAHTAKFDLTLSMHEEAGGLKASLQYNTDLFDEISIKGMLGHFDVLLTAISISAATRVSDVPLVTASEEQQLLDEWNATRHDYPASKSIHELFEAQAERAPEAVALQFEDERVNYRELNAGANRLAHYLRSLGVGPETPVGICVEPSVQMVLALLAVLKAGGCYVPLDPRYPKERLRFMLRDSEAMVLITQQQLTVNVPDHDSQLVCLDRDRGLIDSFSGENPDSGVTGENAAYVIYTSGSTGYPKGVLAPHRGAVNRMDWMWRAHPYEAQEVLCQKTSLNFVDSVCEIFGPLLKGVPLVILSPKQLLDPTLLVAALGKSRVTRIVLVPSLLRTLLHLFPDLRSKLPDLRIVFVSGEALTPDLAKSFREIMNACTLINLYGSSEAAADSTACEISEARAISIGRPIGNTQVYVLDSRLRPVPIGVTGQIYVGGDGLARGYWKRPDLTAERFVPNPFSSSPGERLYRTGDLARFRADGCIEFLGRNDDQVKIRGIRIELGEIESALCGHPGVRQAVVLARETVARSPIANFAAEPQLAAYVVADSGNPLGVRELREFVQGKLPDYLVPSTFVLLDALPLTANGKIERQALPEPVFEESNDDSSKPRSPTEVALAHIWSEVLRVPAVGLNDNFFDLGGHSLLAALLIGRIKNELSVELPLRVLFECPTIAQLSPKVQLKKQESIFHLREQGSFRYLFELQRGDSGRSIFCFPFRGGLNGEFFNFIRVARQFGSQYSFYGVLARGLDGVSEPRRSLAELAADYLEDIRAVQPQGPYIFVGECQGGFVAYESARQMLAAGGEMGLLVLLDSPAGLPARGWWRRSLVPIRYSIHKSPAWKYLRRRYEYHRRAIRAQGALSALSYAVGKAARAFSSIPYLVNLEQSEKVANNGSDHGAVRVRLERLRQVFDVAVRQYRLMRYPGRIALLVNEAAYKENRFQDWTHYVGNNLEVYKLSGDHDTCVPQNIPLVTQILRDCLAVVNKQG